MFVRLPKWINTVAMFILACVFFAPLGVFAETPAQEKRIAVVIGNGAYPSGNLATAANDAGLIAQTLQVAGFDVVGARDLDSATMRATLREFIDKASASGPDTVVVAYFAGHGVQFEGENYLVPIDAHMTRNADVPIEGIRVSDFTKSLAALPLKARVLVLDAARINHFGEANHPLSGGLALVAPEAGSLVAFNAAPGTVSPDEKGPYGSYATALSEMIKAGGLPLNDVFDRTRLRVADLTKGTQLPWQQSRIDVPFTFLEKTADAPTTEADRFADLKAKPLNDFSIADAYQAALARDTLEAYQEFLAAYPKDPLAKRVRAIVAARREAATWHESAVIDTPDAYWSYLRRYPNGPHSYEARQRLSYFNAPYDPPSRFSEYPYDIGPPFADELFYVDRRPYVYFGDPVFDLIAPPILSLLFMPRRPSYFYDMRPPPVPFMLFMLPTPDYYPVQSWVQQPRYIAPPPPSVVTVDIHNTVIVNPATNVPVVTTPAGSVVPLASPTPSPAAPLTPTGQPVAGQAPISVGAGATPVVSAPALGVAIPQAAARRLPPGTLPANAHPAIVAPAGTAPSGATPTANSPANALPGVNAPVVGAPLTTTPKAPTAVPTAPQTLPNVTTVPQTSPAAPAVPKPNSALPVPNTAVPAPIVPNLSSPSPSQPSASAPAQVRSRPARRSARPLPLPEGIQAPVTTPAPVITPAAPAPGVTPKVPAPAQQVPSPQVPSPQVPKQIVPARPTPIEPAPPKAPPPQPAAPRIIQPAPSAPAAVPKKPVACGHPGEPACQ